MEFNPFDRDADIVITARKLPHWFQAGAATFITFRTLDSMPRGVILRWHSELQEWLAKRGVPVELAAAIVDRKLGASDQIKSLLDASQNREFKRLSDRVWHRSLDECHGKCLLRRPELAKIVAEAIQFYDGEKYDLDRFVVMPNHVHVIAQFYGGQNLGVVGKSWMRYSARMINRLVGQSGSFWQPEPFDHIIRSGEQFQYLQRYIAENPRKAKLKEGDFLYWERS